jgi:hypothetical protein
MIADDGARVVEAQEGYVRAQPHRMQLVVVDDQAAVGVEMPRQLAVAESDGDREDDFGAPRLRIVADVVSGDAVVAADSASQTAVIASVASLSVRGTARGPGEAPRDGGVSAGESGQAKAPSLSWGANDYADRDEASSPWVMAAIRQPLAPMNHRCGNSAHDVGRPSGVAGASRIPAWAESAGWLETAMCRQAPVDCCSDSPTSMASDGVRPEPGPGAVCGSRITVSESVGVSAGSGRLDSPAERSLDESQWLQRRIAAELPEQISDGESEYAEVEVARCPLPGSGSMRSEGGGGSPRRKTQRNSPPMAVGAARCEDGEQSMPVSVMTDSEAMEQQQRSSPRAFEKLKARALVASGEGSEDTSCLTKNAQHSRLRVSTNEQVNATAALGSAAPTESTSQDDTLEVVPSGQDVPWSCADRSRCDGGSESGSE